MAGFSNKCFSPIRCLGQQTENAQRAHRLSICFGKRTKGRRVRWTRLFRLKDSRSSALDSWRVVKEALGRCVYQIQLRCDGTFKAGVDN